MGQTPRSNQDDTIKGSEFAPVAPAIQVEGTSRSTMLSQAPSSISSLQPSQRRMSLIQKSLSMAGNLNSGPPKDALSDSANEGNPNNKALAPSSSCSHLKLPVLGCGPVGSALTVSTVGTRGSMMVPSNTLRAQGSVGSHFAMYEEGTSVGHPQLPRSVSQAIKKVNVSRRSENSTEHSASRRSKESGVHTLERVKDEVLIDGGQEDSTEDLSENEEPGKDSEPTSVTNLTKVSYLPMWMLRALTTAQMWLHIIFLNPSAKAWVLFDRLNFLLDIWYLLVVPFASAFFCDQSITFKLHYLVLDFVLILRVILNMNRPKMDAHGQIVLDFASKRSHYLQHMYGWFELIGALPIDWIPLLIAVSRGSMKANFTCSNPVYFYQNGMTSNSWNPALALDSIRYMYSSDEIPMLLFIYSALRFCRLISTARTMSWLLKTNIPFTSSPVSRLVKNLLISLYIAHLDTCIWWMMQSMVPPSDRWSNMYYVTIDHDTLQLTTMSARYIATFYTCQRSLFFVPRERTYTGVEYAYQCFELLAAAIVSGSIIGNLSAVIRLFDRQAALDKAEKNREMQRQFVLQFMVQKRFSVTLQKKVLDQLDFEWIHQRGMDMERMFAELPRSIFLEVCVHLYYALLTSVPLFEGTDDVFKVALCERIFVINVRRGFYLCKAGDAGNEMYFVRSGGVEILTKDESKVITHLGPNAFFGEIALFQECKRTATARTTEDSELCVLKKADFDEILSQHPSMVDVFRRAVAERQERDQKRLKEQQNQAQRTPSLKREAVESANNEAGPTAAMMRSVSALAHPATDGFRKVFMSTMGSKALGGSVSNNKENKPATSLKDIRASSKLLEKDEADI